MTGQQKVLLAVGLMIFGIGAYMSFVQDQVIGVVLMALATTVFALSAVLGAQAKKNKENGDAG
ncbi:hypothetical protein [Erythrobacter alti]|uniref:hypothetical protein n=1 Tax=Erythrobacter alti TaxID=1896145 RepID=UPI0030F497E0